MKVLFILNHPPYGTEHCFNALRLAGAMAKRSPETQLTVFLMADSVLCAKASQRTPDGYYNIERMLKHILTGGGQVLLCGVCMDARGLAEGDILERAGEVRWTSLPGKRSRRTKSWYSDACLS